MAGWSILANGSALDRSVDICRRKSNGCVVNQSVNKDDSVVVAVVDRSKDEYEARLRSLFDQVLTMFVNEADGKDCTKPIPALLGDGQSMDLFKLFWVVRKRGGFDMVNGFWTFVAKELGLDLGVSASIKLIYFKYLYDLENWLRQSCTNGKSGNRKVQSGGNFAVLAAELEVKLTNFVPRGNEFKVGDGKLGPLEQKKHNAIDSKKSALGLLDTVDVHKVCNGVRTRYTDDGDDDDKFHNDKKALTISNSVNSKKELSSRKRKRDSLSEMLKWVTHVAQCPDDPSIGELLPPSKLKDHQGNELWAQAFRARDALLRGRRTDSIHKERLVQSNQKIHPSVYGDFSLSSCQSRERLRCSGRIPAPVKPSLRTCCTSCSAPQSRSEASSKTGFENKHKGKALLSGNLSTASTTPRPIEDEYLRVPVFVGPRFQAEVPEWTGAVSEGDSKWLGTKVWPLGSQEKAASSKLDPIGKGRSYLCDCHFPGSVECIRFHTAEKRVKLKLELGRVFYNWKFDHMGEEVSLRWTPEEENRFKDMVRFNHPSSGKRFWDYAHKYFPTKTRKDLVSYYFNVFIVQRRSYQNRACPENIDSDDDNSSFGALSAGFGHDAVNVPNASKLICTENKQCYDFR